MKRNSTGFEPISPELPGALPHRLTISLIIEVVFLAKTQKRRGLVQSPSFSNSFEPNISPTPNMVIRTKYVASPSVNNMDINPIIIHRVPNIINFIFPLLSVLNLVSLKELFLTRYIFTFVVICGIIYAHPKKVKG